MGSGCAGMPWRYMAWRRRAWEGAGPQRYGLRGQMNAGLMGSGCAGMPWRRMAWRRRAWEGVRRHAMGFKGAREQGRSAWLTLQVRHGDVWRGGGAPGNAADVHQVDIRLPMRA